MLPRPTPPELILLDVRLTDIDGYEVCRRLEKSEKTHLITMILLGLGSALLGALDLLGESARIQVGSDAKWGGIETLKRIRKKP